MAGRSLSRREALASLIGAGATVETFAHAQTPDRNTTEVLSGADFGFQVERTDRDGAKIGRLVVRSDGKWVEARFTTGMRKGFSD